MIEILIKLKDYVPVLQTLVWIIFIILVFITFRKQFKDIFAIIRKRIEKGSSFKAGPFEIGEELKNLDYAKQESPITKQLVGSDGATREKHRVAIYEKNKGIFLTHVISPSDDPQQKFDVFIYLIGHKRTDFSDVDQAEFFFGHMWGNQVFKRKEKNGIIGISTSAYDPFLCTCCVRFKNGDEIQLDRYIDFEMKRVFNKNL
jgi:hypothetical protein